MNRLVANWENVETLELVPGRAIVCKMEWRQGTFLKILAIYAPTVKKENGVFWKKIRSLIKKKRNRPMKPDVLLGDFNQVEDAIDRFPAKKNAIDSPDTFDALKKSLNVVDGWRNTFPNKTEWTWRNADRSSMSRIDRIYLTKDLLLSSRDWTIKTSNLTRNDHSRIGVEIAHPNAPEAGPGRWSMRPDLIKNTSFMTEVDALLGSARNKIEALDNQQRSADHNAQTIWKDFKDSVRELARKLDKVAAGKKRSMLAQAIKDRNKARDDLTAALSE
ncbi:hypothetical protein AURDEDRAFT_73023, partial [Auricularia subglabra TFB-10046 SS5]